MKIQGISFLKQTNNVKLNSNNSVTHLKNMPMDSFHSSKTNAVAFRGDNFDKIRYGAEAKLHVLHSRNLVDNASTIRVNGYSVLTDAKDILSQAEDYKEEGAMLFDKVMDSFEKAQEAGYTMVLGDKDSNFAKRVFHRNPNNEIVMEEYGKRGNLLLRATKGEKQLAIEPFDLDEYNNVKRNVYRFDIETGALREYIDYLFKGNKTLIDTEDYYRFDEAGNLELYANDYKKNKDGSESALLYFEFDSDSNLIRYSEDYELDSNGFEQASAIYRYALNSGSHRRDKKPQNEVLSYSENSIYKPSEGQSETQKYVFNLDNLELAAFYKDFAVDSQGNESSKLAMLFDSELLNETLVNYSLDDDGIQKADKMFYYSDEEPVFCYLNHEVKLSGKEGYDKIITLQNAKIN